MDDEQGAVGQGSSGGASASPLSDDLPSESAVENIGSDDKAREPYDEGDGEEIMVEVVGSDVYVDGIGVEKEGHLESGEFGDLEVHNSSSKGDGKKVEESDLGLPDSRDKKDSVVTEVDDSFSKSVDVKGDAVSALPLRGGDVVDDEVWNPGIKSGASVPDSEVAEPSAMVISEEKKTEDEGVTKDNADLETAEPLDSSVGAVSDDKADTKEKKELLSSSDNSTNCDQASVRNEEIPGPSPIVINEEKKNEDEGVSKGSSELVSPEILNHPVESVLDKKSDLEETQQVVSSSDNSASHAQVSSKVSVHTQEVTAPLPTVISEVKKTEDEAVIKDVADLVTPAPLDHPAADLLDEKIDLSETEEVLHATDISASRDHFPSAVSLPTEDVTGPSPMVISEEKRTEDEAVHKDISEPLNKDDADLVTPEPLNNHAEDVLGEKSDLAETEEVLPATDISASRDHFPSAVSLPTEDVTGPSPMVISEEKRTEDEAVHKDISEPLNKDDADLVTPEPLNNHAEDVLGEKSDLAETEEVLPATDISASCDHFPSAVSLPTEDVTGPSPMVISEEKRTEDEAVHKDISEPLNKDDADLVTPEPLNNHAEDVVGEKSDLAETEEVLPATDISASGDHFSSAVSLPTEDVTGPSPMVISEEKITENEAAHKDSADLVTPEHLDHPVESVSDEKEEKKEVLLSDDNSASGDHFLSAASVLNEEDKGPSPMVISEEKETEDEAVNKESSDFVTPEALNYPAEGISDEKDDSEENKEMLRSSDSSAIRDRIDDDSVMSHEETKAAQNIVEPLEVSLSPNCEGPQNVPVDGIDIAVGEVPLVNASAEGEHLDSGIKEEVRATTDGEGGIDEKSVDEKERFAAKSKDLILESDDLVSDVQDADQGSIDVTLRSDGRSDGVSHAGPEPIHDNSSVSERGEAIGNNERLKDDGDLETHKAHENQVFLNEPNQLTDGGDTADNGKCLNAEIANDEVKNEPNTTSLSCLSDKEITQEDSDMRSDQPVIATMLEAEIDGQDDVISQAEAVGPSDKGGEINPEILALDDSAEHMHIQEEGACSKADAMSVKAIEDVVEERGSPRHTEQEVSVQLTESSNHEVDKIENSNSTPNEETTIAASFDTTEKAELLDIKEKPGCGMASSSDDIYKSPGGDHEPRESNGFCPVDGVAASETEVMDVEEERESDQSYHGGPEVDAELGSEGPLSETEKSSKLSNEEKVKYASTLRMEQSGYLTPPENEGSFTSSDLVWGKVRSHPWWPGQIFDPADASEKALKYHKKDSYLVAYFGDQTFAWNDPSALKPFRSHFTQIEKQSNSESFHNAVSCALEEVERRVELGLACSCIPKDAYAKIETQAVENAGIREEARRRHGVDQSSQASHFEPDKLLDYVRGLAPRASSPADRLDLVIARAQLSAFCRFKGYRSPTEFPLPGELLENDADTEEASDELAALEKHRHIPKDGSQSRDREYSPDSEDELVAEDIGKPFSGKKRKAVDHPVEGSDKRVSVYAAKISASASQMPKPSFKIGECIRRVASQLTGCTSSVKGGNDETVIDASTNINEQSEKQTVVVPPESLSVNEVLSQLELLAQDPKRRRNIQYNIRGFFLGFRSSIVLNRRGRKKKSEQTKGGSGEEFEFDDVNDSYWTDRIVQNYSEEHDGENADKNLQLVPFGAGKPAKAGRKSHSRKRLSGGISPSAADEEYENAKRRKQESSPAELILNFAERNCVPSEINLNKMFRRFGPLMESETEVDHESGCAKVIFKRGSDAEVAQNSAEKFNIFGPVLVDYRIGYSPVISLKVLPVALPQPQEEDVPMML